MLKMLLLTKEVVLKVRNMRDEQRRIQFKVQIAGFTMFYTQFLCA